MVQDKKLPSVGVMNCTGQQGASVLLALWESGRYHVHGLTKNPKSDAMMDLLKTMRAKDEKRAMEDHDIYMFDEDKEDTYEKAFKDLDYVFAMTNPTPKDPEREYKMGKRMVDYAKKMKIKMMLWSSLPNVEEITKGKMKVPQFTMKARIEDYMREQKMDFIAIQTGFFLSNIETSPMFRIVKRGEDWVLRLPMKEDTKLPVLDPSKDMGPAMLNLLDRRDDFRGKSVPIYGDELTIPELVKCIDKRVRYERVDRDELKKMPLDKRDPPLDDDALEMFRYFDEFGFYGKREGIVNIQKQLKLEYAKAEDYFKGRSLLKA